MNTLAEPRYSPTGSVAQAMARGLPARMLNQAEDNLLRAKRYLGSNSRGKTYRGHIAFLNTLTKGLQIVSYEEGRGKNREHVIFSLSPTDDCKDFNIIRHTVKYRNPRESHIDIIGLTFTKHVVERVFQRCTDNYAIALSVLGCALTITNEGFNPGTYEVGAVAGLFIVKMEGEPRTFNTYVITFVDIGKLQPGQSAAFGDIKKIS